MVIILLFFLFLSPLVFSSQAENNFDYFFKNSGNYKDVVVAHVLRTDLIELESGERIRLIGLKSPEVHIKKERPERDEYGFVIEEPKTPVTPVEELVFNQVQELLEGKHVRLEFDVEKKDSEHHTFAYAFLLKDNLFINVEILRQGYADLHLEPPNLKHADELRAAYREASRELRGLQNK